MAHILKDKGVRWISFGWLFFIAENLVLSENRSLIIKNFGEDNYHAVYNSLSTFACGSFLFGYFKYGRGNANGAAMKAARSKFSHVVAWASQSLGLVGISQLAPKFQSPISFNSEQSNGNVVNNGNRSDINKGPSDSNNSKFKMRCPMDFKPKDIPADGIYGMERVSRHATFWSFGAVCLGESLRSIYFAEMAMFTFPLVFAAIGTAHQDSRFRRGMGGTLSPEYEAVTSNLPFAALLTGKQSFAALADEMKWTNAGLAFGVACLRAASKLK